MSKWTAEDIPDQSGRVAVVTGGNSGLGLETVRALAGHGAQVVLASRNLEKGEAARRELKHDNVEVRMLDLSSLDSVRSFAADLGHESLDLLVNNAGIMMTPK